jgi:small-conductance mechanosensitive channel
MTDPKAPPKPLDPNKPHPLARGTSTSPPPTLTEEKAAHAKKLKETLEHTELERRTDHLTFVVDSMFDMLSTTLKPKIEAGFDKLEEMASEIHEQTSSIAALTTRIDGIEKRVSHLEEIDRELKLLRESDTQMGDRITVVEKRLDEIPAQATQASPAELAVRPPTQVDVPGRRVHWVTVGVSVVASGLIWLLFKLIG